MTPPPPDPTLAAKKTGTWIAKPFKFPAEVKGVESVPKIHPSLIPPWWELYARFHPYVGKPVGDVRVDPDGVEVQRFENVTVYRRPHGKRFKTFEVLGGIRDRYDALGGRNSWLGLPESNEFAYDDDGGRASAFQNGAIYWWPDVGAIDINQVSLAYMGFYCEVETYDGVDFEADDEVYAIVATTSGGGVRTFSSRVHDGVDAGETRLEWGAEIYRGPPAGLVVTVALREQDEGDPNVYRKQIEDGLNQVAAGAGVAAGFIPIVGFVVAPIVTGVLIEVGKKLSPIINDWLGTDDDTIGTQQIVLTAKDLCVLARHTPEKRLPEKSEKETIPVRLLSRQFTGHGSKYTAGFNAWAQ